MTGARWSSTATTTTTSSGANHPTRTGDAPIDQATAFGKALAEPPLSEGGAHRRGNCGFRLSDFVVSRSADVISDRRVVEPYLAGPRCTWTRGARIETRLAGPQS